VEVILSRDPSAAPDVIYLSSNVPYLDAYWDFYNRVHGRADLGGRDRGMPADAEALGHTPQRAAAILSATEHAAVEQLVRSGWQTLAATSEPGTSTPSFLVLADFR
jgi:hypothetical protein